MEFCDVFPSRASYITVFKVTRWHSSVFCHLVIEVWFMRWQFGGVLPSCALYVVVFKVTGWYLSVFFHRVIEV